MPDPRWTSIVSFANWGFMYLSYLFQIVLFKVAWGRWQNAWNFRITSRPECMTLCGREPQQRPEQRQKCG